MILSPIRKVASNAASWEFWWVAKDGFASGTPTVTFTTPATGVGAAFPLPVVHASATVTVVADDLRSLTLSADIRSSVQGMIGDWGGEVWIDGGAAFQGPAVIRRWTGSSTLELAERLPHDLTEAVGTVTLYFQLHNLTINDPADAIVTGGTRATVLWAVDWVRSVGDDIDTTIEREEGLLYVCRQPFQTGCTWRNLLHIVPALSAEVPDPQATWAPQIWEAQAELEEWLGEVLPSDKYVDDVNGAAFRGVHGLLAAALVLDGQVGYDRADRAQSFRDRARERFDRLAKRLPYYDLDGDGIVDAGEENVSVRDLGGLFRSWHTTGDYDDDDFDRYTITEDR